MILYWKRWRKSPIYLLTFTSLTLILNGILNITLSEWIREILYYTPENIFLSSLFIFLGVAIFFRQRLSRILTLALAWFYLVLSLTEFLLANYLIHMVVPLIYFLWSVILVMILSSDSVKALFEGSKNIADLAGEGLIDSAALTKGVIILSIWNLVLGMLDLVKGGAREYFLGDILVRLLGISVILTSLGLFGRFEWARRTILVLCGVSLVRVFVTFDWAKADIAWAFWITVLAILSFLPSVIFFTHPSVKKQFTERNRRNRVSR